MREIKFGAFFGRGRGIEYFDDLYYFEENMIHGNSEELPLMQYIGRKDKNGNEIYEGYIVKNEHGDIFLVEWNEDWCGFFLFVAKMDKYGYAVFDDADRCEIIGNIYENPELVGGGVK